MSDLFKEKFRIQSTRKPNWDYSSEGHYFITICCDKFQSFFGEIIESEMFKNEIGILVETCWDNLPKHFNNMELGEFVVMPNHVHGIVTIIEASSASEKN